MHQVDRISCPSINIELEIKKIDRENRWCSQCRLNKSYCINHEFHFLYICPKYNELRNKSLLNLLPQKSNIEHLIRLMATEKHETIVKLALFTYESFRLLERKILKSVLLVYSLCYFHVSHQMCTLLLFNVLQAGGLKLRQ